MSGSNALRIWRTDRAAELDEVESAHAAVGGSGPGRRFATLQINYAYATLLSAQFQGFCRDLHTECVEHVVSAVPASLAKLTRQNLMHGRKLDRGNPNAGNLGSDFGRVLQTPKGFWEDVRASAARAVSWQVRLDEMNLWRNAIAHHDFVPVGRSNLSLAQVRRWRTGCDRLARTFDRVAFRRLTDLTGRKPW